MEDVDVRKDPKRARAEDIKVAPTLVLEYKGKREQTNSASEQDLTGALIKLTRDGKKTVCFLKGEGERETAATSSARATPRPSPPSRRPSTATQDFSLGREAQVPEACTLVVVPGAESDLSLGVGLGPAGVRRRRAAGCSSSSSPTSRRLGCPTSTALVKEWNIEVGDDIVLEITASLTPMGLVRSADERIIVDPGPQYPYHEITRSFGLATYFDGARRVAAGKETLERRHGAESRRDLPGVVGRNRSRPQGDPLRRRKGHAGSGGHRGGGDHQSRQSRSRLRLPRPHRPPTPPKPPETRVAVFGDTDFASNGLIRQAPGNETLFLGTVAWLTGDQDLISIPPKDPEDHRLNIIPGTDGLLRPPRPSRAGHAAPLHRPRYRQLVASSLGEAHEEVPLLADRHRPSRSRGSRLVGVVLSSRSDRPKKNARRRRPRPSPSTAPR